MNRLVVLSALIAALSLAGAPAAGATAPASVDRDAASRQPIAVRFGGDPGVTRIVLDLNAPPVAAALTRDKSHVALRLARAPGAESLQGTARGLVRQWRFTAQGAGALLELDLAPGAAVVHRFNIPPAVLGAPWRYVVDVGFSPDQATSSPTLAARSSPSSRATEPDVLDHLLTSVRNYAPSAAQAPRVVAHPAPVAIAQAPAPPLVRLAAADPGPLSASAPQLTPDRASRRGAPEPRPQPAPNLILASAPSAPRQPSPSARSRPPSAVGRKIIVIDAGHGGHDVGAKGASDLEKDMNLAAALALRERLEASGRYRVVMTRADDTFIPLDQRVKIARRAHADLFISLHSDSAGADTTPHGASVYTLSDTGVNRVHTVLTSDDPLVHAADPKAGGAVGQILIDLSQRSTRNRSAEFAQVLLDHIASTVDLLPRSHRDAGYFVLLAPDVPAVLLEMGFITNPGDEARLSDPERRHAFMDRVAAAIDDYFSPPRQLAAVGR